MDDTIVLYFVVGESAVGLGHAVRVLFFLYCATFAFAGGDNFSCELFRHALAAALAGIFNQPFHPDGNFALSADFRWDLEGGAPDAAAAHLDLGHNVIQSLFPEAVFVLLSAFGDQVEGLVEHAERGALFAFVHQVIDELGDHRVVVAGICGYDPQFWFPLSHGRSVKRL